MTGITENDPKAAAFEELRDRATRAGHAEGFASAIQALHDSLRNGTSLQNPTPSVEPLANPEAASFDQVWQHYATIGFGSGWSEGVNSLVALLGYLPRSSDGLMEVQRRLVEQSGSLPLSTPVEDLDFMVRTYNCLKREGIHTVEALLKQSEATLLEFRHFGTKSIDEVIAKLATYGYKLSPSPRGFTRE